MGFLYLKVKENKGILEVEHNLQVKDKIEAVAILKVTIQLVAEELGITEQELFDKLLEGDLPQGFEVNDN